MRGRSFCFRPPVFPTFGPDSELTTVQEHLVRGCFEKHLLYLHALSLSGLVVHAQGDRVPETMPLKESGLLPKCCTIWFMAADFIRQPGYH